MLAPVRGLPGQRLNFTDSLVEHPSGEQAHPEIRMKMIQVVISELAHPGQLSHQSTRPFPGTVTVPIRVRQALIGSMCI